MDEIWIPGKPIPFTRTGQNPQTGHRYQHPEYREWKESAGWHMKADRPGPPTAPGAIALEVKVQHDGISLWVDRIAPSHRPYKQGIRGDLDNYVKAVLDAGNGVLFEDDRQVVRLNSSFVLLD